MPENETIGLKGEQMSRDTHATPLLNDQREGEALLTLNRDITEYKRAEAKRDQLKINNCFA